MGYIFIFLTIVFTVYGQLILKHRIGLHGAIPNDMPEKILFICKLFIDPWILSGFVSAFVASLFWIMTLTKFELSFAYPFMSLSFVLVFIVSIFLFHESVTIMKVAGLLLVIGGLIVLNISK